MYTIEKTTIKDDFRILNEIASFLSKEIDAHRNYDKLIFLMEISQKQNSKKNGFNPFKNLFFYLEVSFYLFFIFIPFFCKALSENKIESTVHQFFLYSSNALSNPSYLCNFFKNLLKSAFCNASVNFFFFFSKEAITKKKFDIFLNFFHEIVRTDLCFRLRSEETFLNVEATLKLFYIGWQPFYA